jgi:hypothetical protein
MRKLEQKPTDKLFSKVVGAIPTPAGSKEGAPCCVVLSSQIPLGNIEWEQPHHFGEQFVSR